MHGVIDPDVELGMIFFFENLFEEYDSEALTAGDGDADRNLHYDLSLVSQGFALQFVDNL